MCTFSEYNKIKMYLVLHFKVSSRTEAVWLRDLQFIQDMAWQKTNDEHTQSEVKLRSASTNPKRLRPSCYFAVSSACVCVTGTFAIASSRTQHWSEIFAPRGQFLTGANYFGTVHSQLWCWIHSGPIRTRKVPGRMDAGGGSGAAR